MQGHARHRRAVNLEDEKVLDGPLQLGPGPRHELVGLHAGLDQFVNRPDVPLLGRADRLVLVGVDECANPLVGEDLGQ